MRIAFAIARASQAMASQGGDQRLRIHVIPARECKSPDDRTYQMVKKQRGVCLIVSIEEFDAPSDGAPAHEPREGAEVDRENLKELFRQLGFMPIVIKNGTKAEIKERAREVRRMEECKGGDMFVAVVLSHGKEGYFVTRGAIQ